VADMDIRAIFSKNLIVEIKKRVENCVESHRWIILESQENNLLHLKKLHENFLYYSLEIGDKIEIEIFASTGIFIFESTITAADEKNIEIIVPEKVKKIIKRDSKRVETKLGAYIAKSKAMVLDISESGVYCIAKEEFGTGEIVVLNIVHDDLNINLKSKIVRKEKILNGGTIKNYGYGLKFEDNDFLKEEISKILKTALKH